MNDYLLINENDSVVIALKDLDKGYKIMDFNLLSNVKRGFKIALKDINAGEPIIKYGSTIGIAKINILKGEVVHINNLMTSIKMDESYSYNKIEYSNKFNFDDVKVNVFNRGNNMIGIRNNLLILPLVGCINSISNKIKESIKMKANLINVDNIISINHSYGCSQLGDDLRYTKETLSSLCLNPNFGGVLVLSLGCENNKLDEFKLSLGDYDKNRFRFITLQDSSDDINEACKLGLELIDIMNKDKRELMPLSNITIGMKCGGSDAFSGITANPLLGLISDYFIKNGGSILLSEVPEMFGAERELMNRCKDARVFNKYVKLINDFKEYYKSHNQVCYSNPSPGNINGGISSLEDKSLGCIRKGGYSEVVDCLRMNEKIKVKGLNILESPGNDLISSTLLSTSNSNLILFTTGRGTPFGSVVPTLKISTNKELYDKKKSWIDYDSSIVLDKGFDYAFNELKDLVIKTINGEYKTINEQNEYFDIAIFKDGVIL